MNRINRIIAIANITICSLELFLLLMTIINNKGTTNLMAVFWSVLIYLWPVMPAVVFLNIANNLKSKKFANLVFLIVNGSVLIINVPMLMVCMKGS